MTAINHAVTGALIGLACGNPLIALPAALLSHFVCDALPHFGSSGMSDQLIGSAFFKWFLITDITLCGLLVLVLGVTQPAHWLLAAVCAFVATAPDFTWLPGYLRVRQGKPFVAARRNVLLRFAAAIQWFERPSGALVEVVWFGAVTTLIAAYL